jgi:hypothetical protein
MSACGTNYSRQSPSPRYSELLAQYAQMHVAGDVLLQTPPERTYCGRSMPCHARAIKELIDEHCAKSILDYGAGKGLQYRDVRVEIPGGPKYPSIPAYWGIESLTCYDPAYEPFRQLPTGPFDGVVCTDVLEHCPEGDLEWILGELFTLARRFVFASVACYPATKRLPTGENAHCTVRPQGWWVSLLGRIAVAHPRVRFQFIFDRFEAQPDGALKKIGEIVSG